MVAIASGADRLVAFLNARLDEDEAVAVAAAGADGGYAGRPDWSSLGCGIVVDTADPDWAVVDISPYIEDANLGTHVARHDPARVLRDIGGKRKILAEHEAVTKLAGLTEQELGFLGWYRVWVLKHLAGAYADHPDYDPAWTP